MRANQSGNQPEWNGGSVECARSVPCRDVGIPLIVNTRRSENDGLASQFIPSESRFSLF